MEGAGHEKMIATMPNTTLTGQTARLLEDAELAAWRDLYAAIPKAFFEQYRPELVDLDGVLLTRCPGISFVHFPRARP